VESIVTGYETLALHFNPQTNKKKNWKEEETPNYNDSPKNTKCDILIEKL
jgi:hypothetical protein